MSTTLPVSEPHQSEQDTNNNLIAAPAQPGEEQEEETRAVVQGVADLPSSGTALEEPEESEEEEEEPDEGSYYWKPETMAPLNAVSAAAVARLRAFNPPPFPLWDRLPVSRRAAVLLLLYADRKGDLRVVITMRAATLRSFSGHAALPGGKADTIQETAYQIARREAYEEIGLPLDNAHLPPPFTIEHLCYLPANLARTELVVRPVVALLHTSPPSSTATSPGSSPNTSPVSAQPNPTITAEDSLIPKLDAKEVAAVFSAPFFNFLKSTDEPGHEHVEGEWYNGAWTEWHEEPWRMHFFYVPVTSQRVTKPKVREGGLAALAEDHNPEDEEAAEEKRYKVWGMTARILVDAATIAYGEKPEFEHNSHFGDERIIEGLERLGRLTEKKRRGSSMVTKEDVKKAAEVMTKKEEGSKM
ncbi:putative peroxisomal coenzyme A diphosphatase precursor [Triangularia verruculosa]|uniref:Peroxisomal coenzyme A diphosphatase n=1 Tax=Triangularia verruculosa TaxID=2587418 RepID=A0AAN7ATG2_9PEZI|nr:putative peroxisomal coenzyme A diphosphatase precursor [Triangularia verruculosa]